MSTKECIELAISILSIVVLIVTAYYVANAPIKAVIIGRELDKEKNRIEEKTDLFLTLYELRGNPIHYDFVRALNRIDVVFSGEKKVLDTWYKYYHALHNKPEVDTERVWELQRVELLTAMADSLGYGGVQQTDIMKYYYPEGHQFEFQSDQDLKKAAFDFLKSGNETHALLSASLKDQRNGGISNTEIS